MNSHFLEKQFPGEFHFDLLEDTPGVLRTCSCSFDVIMFLSFTTPQPSSFQLTVEIIEERKVRMELRLGLGQDRGIK